MESILDIKRVVETNELKTNKLLSYLMDRIKQPVLLQSLNCHSANWGPSAPRDLSQLFLFDPLCPRSQFCH